MRLLVTGAAGFIGSHFVREIRETRPDVHVAILDALTYSGNLTTIQDLMDGGVPFYQARIEDAAAVDDILAQERSSHIVNFAAESHNDRSLGETATFLTSNAIGVEVLLHATRRHGLTRMVHVSTDEVYGSIGEGKFTEESCFRPNTPYSAAKAAGDLQCRAHFQAYRTPVVVTRGGNTYGPYQYPEKLIPFFTVRLLLGKRVPLYGDGTQVREWIHARDHARGILAALERGVDGEAYNVGDHNETENRVILERLLTLTGRGAELVKHIEDPRKGAHDARYSMTTGKLEALGWRPQVNFRTGLEETVAWYRNNTGWWEGILADPEYQEFIARFYGRFLGEDL